MLKCSPVEMRKALIIVDELRKAGIEFVAVPVINSAHKAELIMQSDKVLEKLAEEFENEANL